MSERRTPGTLRRDARMAQLAPVQAGWEITRQQLKEVCGCFAKTPDGKIVEITSILNDNPVDPIVEWLAGNEWGESRLVLLEPTDEKPQHILEYEGCPTEDYNPHRRFETTTPDGHTITIKGDPRMDAKTLECLHKTFDALYRKYASDLYANTKDVEVFE